MVTWAKWSGGETDGEEDETKYSQATADHADHADHADIANRPPPDRRLAADLPPPSSDTRQPGVTSPSRQPGVTPQPQDPRNGSGGKPTSCSGGMPPDPRTSSGGKPTSRTQRSATTDLEEGGLPPNFGTTAEDLDEDSEDRDPMILESGGKTLRSEDYRRKNGSGLAGKIISALVMSANALAGAARESWTKTVRYNRLDFAEVCCTADRTVNSQEK